VAARRVKAARRVRTEVRIGSVVRTEMKKLQPR
jgi:hypothetical protein